ncbi:helix-turn-helix domain-containing protein [Micromonospora sp. M12]
MPTSGKALAGRRAQAARNDEVILEAARAVFLDDPKAPIAAVAERAGVGISALYRRYAGKEDLLRQLCHDGLRRYVSEAESALAEADDWQAFAGFLARVVDADVHSLTVHLAGTFTPTEEMARDAMRAGELATALFERARASGRLRPTRSSRIWGCCWRRAPRSAYPIRSGPVSCAAGSSRCCWAVCRRCRTRTRCPAASGGRRVRLAVATPGVMGITR